MRQRILVELPGQQRDRVFSLTTTPTACCT